MRVDGLQAQFRISRRPLLVEGGAVVQGEGSTGPSRSEVREYPDARDLLDAMRDRSKPVSCTARNERFPGFGSLRRVRYRTRTGTTCTALFP